MFEGCDLFVINVLFILTCFVRFNSHYIFGELYLDNVHEIFRKLCAKYANNAISTTPKFCTIKLQFDYF